MKALNTVTEGLPLPSGDAYFVNLLDRVPVQWFLDQLDRAYEDGAPWDETGGFPLERVFNNHPLLESLDATSRVKLLYIFIKIHNQWDEEALHLSSSALGDHCAVIEYYSPRILILTLTESFIASLDPAAIRPILGVVNGYILFDRSIKELEPIARLLGDRYPKVPEKK